MKIMKKWQEKNKGKIKKVTIRLKFHDINNYSKRNKQG
jgi:hypothetical protein